MLSRRLWFKHLLYGSLSLFVYFVFAHPSFPVILNNVPFAALSCTILYAMFERERAGAIAGLVLGLLCDMQAISGYNSLFLLIAGCTVGLLIIRYVNLNLSAAILFSSAVSVVYYILTFLIFEITSADFLQLLISKILPKIILTIILTLALYPLFKKIKAITTN